LISAVCPHDAVGTIERALFAGWDGRVLPLFAAARGSIGVQSISRPGVAHSRV
jgi:hypothetical protein